MFFYKDRLKINHNLETLFPDKLEREYIHNIIYKELAQGKFLNLIKQKILQIIEKLVLQGAEGIILGCTEIPLLINSNDVDIPLFDTLKIHIKAALNLMLS